MNYKSFRRFTEKKLDAWVEVLLFDPVSTFLSYLVCLFTTSKKMPYLLTLLSFIMKSTAAFSFFFNQIIMGIFLVLLGDIFDGMDGKVSRCIYKRDPEKRGTLDFLLDHVALALLIIGLGSVLLARNMTLVIGLLAYVAMYIILSSFISTKFRLYAKIHHNPDVHLLEREEHKRSFLLQTIQTIQKRMGRYRLVFHPSAVDAEFFIFVAFPLFNFNALFLYIGILFVAIDLVISGVGPVYLTLAKEK